jgi:hypothetical protein
MTLAPEISARPRPKADKLVGILLESALSALINAMLVLLFGSIALQCVGGIFHDMIPSRPPEFGTPLPEQPETSATASFAHWVSPFQKHRFAIVFSILFVLTARARLLPLFRSPRARRKGPVSRIAGRFSDRWFELIVWNAFGAMFGAMLFSWVHPPIHSAASHLLGTDHVRTFDAWFAWYGINKLKFAFWALYIAAICDDLGIPNWKTLCRRLWRRYSNRRKTAGETSSLPQPIPLVSAGDQPAGTLPALTSAAADIPLPPTPTPPQSPPPQYTAAQAPSAPSSPSHSTRRRETPPPAS